MKLRPPSRQLCRPHIAGFTLVELMVGLVIALVISLVVFNVFIVTEGQRRTTAGGSDAQQAGALSSYTLMRYLRMGGAGIDRIDNLWGCNIQMTRDGTTLLPLPTSIGEPFVSLGLADIHATPVLIINGSSTGDNNAASSTPDALMAFGGVHRSINTFLQGSRAPAADGASVYNSVGLQENDLLLAVEQTPASPNFGGNCQVVQSVSEINTNAGSPTYLQSMDNNGRTVNILGGLYTPSSGLVPNGVAYTGETYYANLGGSPLFRLFALGPSADAPSELRMYDVMLGATDTNPQSLGDGVVNLQAVYGVAAPGSTTNVIADWVHPVGAWSAGSLMDGSAASAALIDRIRAIRVVMVTRSALPERDPVSPDEYTVFADDESLTLTIERDTDAQKYRYRVFDEIVPVRNKLLPPTPPPMS
jgi:type IV pilus assembly protein PilW